MCVIVDADKSHGLVKDPLPNDVKPLQKWLSRDGSLVYSTGGIFDRQYSREVRDYFRFLSRNNKAIQFNLQVVEEKMTDLPDEGALASDENSGRNDRHILALALVSGAEVLYTGDQNLMKDFQNKKIMGHSNGKIYSSEEDKGRGLQSRKLFDQKNLCSDCKRAWLS